MDSAQIIAQLTAVGAVLIPIDMGLIQLIKRYIGEKYAPIASLFVGIGLSFIFPAATVPLTVLQGILIGLAASGLYSNVRSLVSK